MTKNGLPDVVAGKKSPYPIVKIDVYVKYSDSG
jgi:hypothetical protein